MPPNGDAALGEEEGERDSCEELEVEETEGAGELETGETEVEEETTLAVGAMDGTSTSCSVGETGEPLA